VDANLRDVLVAAITVTGTLGGIWLGWILNGRHRHDDEKRRAYARLIGIARGTIYTVERGDHYHVAADVIDRYRDQFDGESAVVQLLGAKPADDAARDLNTALIFWMTHMEDHDLPSEVLDERWGAKREAVMAALAAFIDACKRDLGLGSYEGTEVR
jgi:hypothetical protein